MLKRSLMIGAALALAAAAPAAAKDLTSVGIESRAVAPPGATALVVPAGLR